MKTKLIKAIIGKSVMIGLAGVGFWWGGAAQAQIALHDGGLSSTNYAIPATNSTISMPFTNTAGASVMVVELYDNNHQLNNSSPSFFTWSNATLNTTQLLTRAVSQNNAAYDYVDIDIFYVFNPTLGAGVVSGTDTNNLGDHFAMCMQVFTLSGVDTTVTPVPYSRGNNGVHSLSVTASGVPSGAWAATFSINANTGHPLTNAATSGTSSYIDISISDGPELAMGYIAGLSAGSSTISSLEDVTGGSTWMALETTVFAPVIPTAAPTNVVAAGQLNKIALSWDDASGGAAGSYTILRSLASGSGFTAIATNIGNASTNYTDSSVTDWTTNYYEVTATGSGGASPPSAPVASAYAVGPAIPPSGVTATNGVNEVALTWNADFGANSFTVLRSMTSGSGFSTLVSGVPTNGYNDTSGTEGTRYYYEVNANNTTYGTGANSPQVSAIPCVALFTNWVGLITSPASTNGWLISEGNPAIEFYDDADLAGVFSAPSPPPPSTGALVNDAFYGPGATNYQNGIKTNLPGLNLSTYTALEFDVANVANTWDDIGVVGQIEYNYTELQGVALYVAPSYTLFKDVDGQQWVHQVLPMPADFSSPGNLTDVTSLILDISDGAQSTTSSNEELIGYANLEFTGAPGYLPVCSGLSSPTISSGTASVTLTGTVGATVGGVPFYLNQGTPITATINGNTQSTSIDDATGDFSITYTGTGGLPNAVYPITYKSASDMVSFVAGTNTATSLTVGTITAVPPPTIPHVTLNAAGTAVQIVATNSQAGHTYYLLQTTSLSPPVVWTTNTSFGGTGANVTNAVPINSARDLYLKWQVN